MAFKRIIIMDIFEIIRRWHNRQKISHIAQSLGYDRKTVRNYIHQAQQHGITLHGPLPNKQHLIELIQPVIKNKQRPTTAQQILAPYLPEIVDLINDQHHPLKPKLAFEVICERHDLTAKVSYSSFKRFIRRHQIIIAPHKATCRIEVPPGSEIQIDYGKVGLINDPLEHKRRTIYAFIATLAYSRHKYVEFVYKQDQQSFVASHVNMFEYFEGVTQRLVIDNLKNGVIKADLYDPRLNRTYQEMAEHYHYFIDPCRVRHPKDKGKVERDVQTIRDQFRKLLALYPQLDIQQANRHIKSWLTQQYGQRPHGTTQLKPYVTFIELEQPTLQQLPSEPFVIAQWKQATVHPDHYVQFNHKLYSVPHRYVGKKVWLKGTHQFVEIYDDYQLVKRWIITANYRHTDWHDFPANVRAALDDGLPLQLQAKAARIGPQFKQLVRHILKPHAFINLRKAQGLLTLAANCNPKLIEQAATVALQQQLAVTPNNFKRLLEQIDQQHQTHTPLPLSQQSLEFIRDANYFVHEP